MIVRSSGSAAPERRRHEAWVKIPCGRVLADVEAAVVGAAEAAMLLPRMSTPKASQLPPLPQKDQGRRLIFALVFALAGVQTGCAKPTSSMTTLTFWTIGREGEVVQPLLRDFERTHPTIHVALQQCR